MRFLELRLGLVVGVLVGLVVLGAAGCSEDGPDPGRPLPDEEARAALAALTAGCDRVFDEGPSSAIHAAAFIIDEHTVELAPGFRERLFFLARVASLVWVAEAVQREADIAKHIRWVVNAFSGLHA